MTKSNIKYIAHRRKSDGQEQGVETHLYEVSEIAGNLAAKLYCGELNDKEEY